MGKTLIVAGTVLICIALLLLVAGSRAEPSDPLRSSSTIVFPLALLLIAAGTYVNARQAQKTVENISLTLKGQGPAGMTCARCRQDRALMYCSSHEMPLCLVCMTAHDAKTCLYMPMFRTVSTPARRAPR